MKLNFEMYKAKWNGLFLSLYSPSTASQYPISRDTSALCLIQYRKEDVTTKVLCYPCGPALNIVCCRGMDTAAAGVLYCVCP